MKPIHQQVMIEAKRLYLTKGRRRRYYIDTFILVGIFLIVFFLIAKGFINKQGNYKSSYFLIFLVFPILAGLLYFHQKQSLRLKEIETDLSKQENYRAVKATLQMLQWQIKVDNRGFIEAYTNDFGILTWFDQMFSIVITDDRIFVNSICNVDTYATQAFVWGQNLRNVKQFKNAFEQVAMMQFS